MVIKMKRDEVVAILTARQEELGALEVKSLDLFGSVARDEAGPDSDVDFLVEFAKPGGLFQLFRVQQTLFRICLGMFYRFGNS